MGVQTGARLLPAHYTPSDPPPPSGCTLCSFSADFYHFQWKRSDRLRRAPGRAISDSQNTIQWEMNSQNTANGGRFNFDDGGTYIGGWEEGKAHGHGICTGPLGKGEYAGAWHYGFEVSGVYSWPSGNYYEGQWQNGKLHGLGVEHRGRTIYMGEFSQGYKGRYGVRKSTINKSHYEGTWSAGFHDGYGTETYVDGGIYQGQWLRGTRHGYGIRKSSQYGTAAKYRSRSHTNASMTSLRSGRAQEEYNNEEEQGKGQEGRGGFVLRANSNAPQRRRRSLSERSLAVKRTILTGLRIKKQHSTGDIHQRVTNTAGSLRSSGSTMSCASDESLHRAHLLPSEEEPVDDTVSETYYGEWKNDTRSGFGICERTDGLKFLGEWSNNAKNGYGVTYFKDGTREEGKYKNNVLVASTRRRNALFVRSARIRERVEASVEAAQRAASIAKQKSDIAASRTITAKERADQAVHSAKQAHIDGELAHRQAGRYDPNYAASEISRRQLTMQGGSFNTEGSDPMSLSRHLSQTHSSNQGSFEQNLSVDLGDGAYLTPMGPGPSYLTTSNHVGANYSNHPGPSSYHSVVPNHVNFQLPDGGPHHYQHQAQVTIVHDDAIPSTSHEEPLPPSSQLDQVVEVADPSSLQKPSTSQLNPGLQGNQQTSSSRFSLSDDHFDQYVVASAANAEQPRIRRNRPSLMRQSDVNDVNMLNRRSTVAATSRARPIQADPGPSSDQENMGSLPNLAELETSGVRLRREDAARLASQRRQEVLRDAEEAALLRQNPLRYLMHPQLRVWLREWRIPLFLALINLTLLFAFYNLLVYDKKKNR